MVTQKSAAEERRTVWIKVVAWLGLTCVQIFAAVILKVAQTNGDYTFSPQSSLVLSEGIKVILSAAFLVYDKKSANASRQAFQQETSGLLMFHMFCLAAIYMVNNGIAFFLFKKADPGSITLIKSGATIVSAIMLYFWRNFKLSPSRWTVIILQVIGLIVAQYNNCTGKSHLPLFIYMVLVFTLLNSSIANVWNEHVVKNFESASLATKNIHLYFYGAVLNLLLFLFTRITKPDSPRFFEGYNLAGAGVVMSNAFMGIAINVVYKYADALIKNIATTTTTIVVLMISGAFFGGRSDVMVFLGSAVVIIGTFLYFNIGLNEVYLGNLETQVKQKLGPADDEVGLLVDDSKSAVSERSN
eukprot:Plantae.Rhodophyta-Hildenbrandia_rubra.ctg27719.p1 GENE.Plantae.Rhodophyta-Hildenbrandia_rubra.ctg27719~~Plantae.Rhodophyta-Hildenbrandia_rubra.ctg27719.p1  ORF type:complete len:357 (+),score=52.05 Plantae.Rhodophyta-Hildenbrandia_rubra.ctg27719:286-1356(+)